jgi:hypothetical protein
VEVKTITNCLCVETPCLGPKWEDPASPDVTFTLLNLLALTTSGWTASVWESHRGG